MELTYNGVDLHDIGEITVSQGTEYEGGEMPTRAKRTLTVTLDVFEETFASNQALLQQVTAALKVQHGVLLWKDEDTGTEWVNQSAVVESQTFPDDPNAWGRYHQQVQVVFSFYEQNLETGSAAVTLSFTAGNIELAQMTEWKESISFERFDSLHAEQKFAVVSIEARGIQTVATTGTVAERRTALHALRDTWKARVLGVNETALVNGTFSKTVRLERFDAEVNQAVNAIGWSFSAFYNVLPDEASYAIADYRVTERGGDAQMPHGTGEQFLTVTGTVKASSEALALTRINAIRDAQMTARAYAQGEVIRQEIDDSRVTGGTTRNGEVFIERSFTLEFRKWRSDNRTLTLLKAGRVVPVDFGQVIDFTDGYNARRANDQRSHRSLAQGRLEIRGTLCLGAVVTPVDARRDLLQKRIQGMHDAVNAADGTLTFGSYFTGVVRVEDFQPKVNQSLTSIDWTMTCHYSKFPNEAGYATVEMQAEQAEEAESGDATLAISGVIRAQSEAAARTKLDTVRVALLAQYGYAAKQQMRTTSTVNSLSANGDKTAGLSAVEASDGTTFIELNFSEGYRKRVSSLVSWNLRVADAADARGGFLTTTYSGDVTASGSTAAAAYATALAKAQALGDGKYPFRVRNDITWTQRQVKAAADIEFVRLEFSYEYQRKDGARVYAEINSAVSTVTFGSDGETISGSISAADRATAHAHYLVLVRNALAGRLILEESLTSGTQQVQATDGGTFVTPQFTRLEFQLNVFKRRTTGTQALRYAIDTEKDWLTLTQRSTVSGSCWAATETEARAAATGFLGTLGLGTAVRSRTTANVQRWMLPTAAASEFGQLDFEESFETRLTGAAGILSCEVSEEVEYSATRWIEQPLPRNAAGGGGVSLFQNAGVEPGRRTIRGSVVASTKAVGLTWAHKQRLFLTGTIEEKPVVGWQYVFPPRVDGVTSGLGENVQMVRVSFTFSERLAENAYAAPA